MKNHIFYFALFLLLSACGNEAATYQEAIDELTTSWDASTTAINSFGTDIRTQQNNWQQMNAAMTVDPEVRAKMSEDMVQKLTSLETACKGHGGIYASVAQEAGVFLAAWTESSKEVNALKESLAGGNVPENIAAKIKQFKTSIVKSNTKLENWKDKVRKTKEECLQTCKSHKELVDSVE